MVGVGPYRGDTFPSWTEEDLWLRLDEALLLSLREPNQAYGIAWSVFMDSHGFTDVRQAASDMMSLLVSPIVE